MVVIDTAGLTDINNLITALTVTVVPAFLGLATGIVNFIQHHSNRADIKAGATKDLEYIQKFADLDKKISDKSAEISTAINLIGTTNPQIANTVEAHDKQLKDAQAALVSLTAEINKIKGLIPAG